MAEYLTLFLGFDEIGERIEQLVFDDDGFRGPAGGLQIFGRRDGDRLAPIADLVSGQHRSVGIDLADCGSPGHVVMSEDCIHTGDGRAGGQHHSLLAQRSFDLVV